MPDPVVKVTGVVWGGETQLTELAHECVVKQAKAKGCATVQDVMSGLDIQHSVAARLLRTLTELGRVEQGTGVLNKRRVNVYKPAPAKPAPAKASPSRRG